MINGTDFVALQRLLESRCGMQLTSDKLYLVAARLGPVAQKLGFKGVIELMAELRGAPRETTVLAVIEAMVTHESLFFRDSRPFEYLSKTVLPDLVRSRAEARSIRVWSAACSSGQEPYSIAMQMREEFAHLPGWRWQIVATDISEQILAKAGSGVFSDFEVRRGLTEERMRRHMHAVAGGYKINDSVRALVDFRKHNLIEPAAHLGKFDIVFCRNVLIYFDQPVKRRVLEHIARQLAPDGYLFLGAADGITRLTDKFDPVEAERGVFRLAGSSAATTKANGVGPVVLTRA